MPAKIQKIVLNIDGEEIKLTLKQAKELQKILNETFGENKVTFVNPYPVIVEPIRVTKPYWSVDYTTAPTLTFTSRTDNETPLLISQ